MCSGGPWPVPLQGGRVLVVGTAVVVVVVAAVVEVLVKTMVVETARLVVGKIVTVTG
jgi:hypothetical protein